MPITGEERAGHRERPISVRRRKQEGGSALVEFVVSFSLLWIPLFTGTLYIGFNLVRAIQATQICRDAGHLYSYGTDFSQRAQQTLLASLAPGLTFTPSGSALILLTTVRYVDSTDCTSAGLVADTQHCPNMNLIVMTRRIAIGNTMLGTSAFGTPASTAVDSSGNITPARYLTDAGAVATNFSSVIPLQSTQYAFVSEAWVTSWWQGAGSSAGATARSIF